MRRAVPERRPLSCGRGWRFDTLGLLVAAVLGSSTVLPTGAFAAPPSSIDFGRDILPILSDNCFHCHGPDAKTRKADLRLDVEGRGAEDDRPGDRAGQERRERAGLADRQHGPGRGDAAAEVEPQAHGRGRSNCSGSGSTRARVGPALGVRPAAPAGPAGRVASRAGRKTRSIASSSPGSNAEGLQPSPEAAARRLIRRVTLDLTGLPPTAAEVDAFLADRSPDAYEKLVDRLLASPRYGERMAWDWLDAARYADSNGYQGDGERTMWPWRDWVVRGAQRATCRSTSSPSEQLAGDLLPGRDRSSRSWPPASTAIT